MKAASVLLLLLLSVAPALAKDECPAGFTYNSEGGYCETLPGCPAGLALDNEDPVCIAAADAQKSCPDGSSYQAAKGRCEGKTTCPAGSQFDAGIEKCVIRK